MPSTTRTPPARLPPPPPTAIHPLLLLKRKIAAEDLHGLPAISYLRFSSPPQGHEGASSIERQQEVLDRALERFQLRLDQAFQDRALSASKGHHRKRGKLRDIAEAVGRGDFLNDPHVLVVEAVDRLVREGAKQSFALLSDFVSRGLILVFGSNLDIWCSHRLDTSENHAIIAAINAAKDYTDRMSEFAAGAHKRRRTKLATLARGGAPPEAAPRIRLNGRTPGWLDRTADGRYVLNEHAETVRRIFELCAAGWTSHQIADRFNRDRVPLMRWTEGAKHGAWRQSRIGALLRNEKVLGWHQPTVERGGKRIPEGPRARVYDPAVSDDLWLKAQAVLDGRTRLVGRRGAAVPNLFTRHVFCPACGGALRSDTGGQKGGAPMRRRLICARRAESKTCGNRTRYQIDRMEADILGALLSLLPLAPTWTADAGGLVEERAALLLEADNLDASIAVLARKAASSAAIAREVERMADESDAARSKASELQMRIDAEARRGSVAGDACAFLRDAIAPARRGDAEARERLRSLLSRHDYRIDGLPTGGLVVSVPGVGAAEVDPPGSEPADHDNHLSEEEKRLGLAAE